MHVAKEGKQLTKKQILQNAAKLIELGHTFSCVAVVHANGNRFLYWQDPIAVEYAKLMTPVKGEADFPKIPYNISNYDKKSPEEYTNYTMMKNFGRCIYSRSIEEKLEISNENLRIMLLCFAAEILGDKP